MPPHKVTLRRVLANVVALCLFLGVVVSLPEAARINLSFAASLYAPTIIVIAIAVYLSCRMLRTLGYVSAGAAVGWILAPRMMVNWISPPSAWDLFVLDFKTVGLSTAGVALLVAMIDWFYTTRKRRQASAAQPTGVSHHGGSSTENPYTSPAEHGESQLREDATRQSFGELFRQYSFFAVLPGVMFVFWLSRYDPWIPSMMLFYVINGVAILFPIYGCLRLFDQGKKGAGFIGAALLVILLVTSALPIWRFHESYAGSSFDDHWHYYWDMLFI